MLKISQEQLSRQSDSQELLCLLDAACVAAADQELRPVLSELKLHETLGAILFQAAATGDSQAQEVL